MKGLKLPKNKKISIENNIKEFKTDYLYFEIPTDYEVIVKEHDQVYKNTILATSKNNTSIISSVSGEVIEINNYIKIKNDYLEKEEKIDIGEINREKFISLLKDSGIKGMGGAGFPTYKKYESNSIKTLIVNAIECEPYITADYNLSKEHGNEIIEAINKIMEINNIEKCYIGIKENNYGMEIFFKESKNIKVVKVKDFYPAGYERSLIKCILNEEYQNIPIEKGIVVNNISTIYAIGNLLKGKRLTDRIVTITGDINNSGNYLVKIGTKVEDIIKQFDISNKQVIIGGPMMGKLYSSDIITSLTNCILIINNDKEKILPCIRCGKCIEVCPRYLEPVLIKDSINNIPRLKKLDPKRCIECGLCSYVCPSKIKLRDKVIEAKGKVK